MRFIPTGVHGALDYTTAVGLMALPLSLRLSSTVGRLLTGAGLGTILYSVMTRYELGLVPILPMKAHLAIDMGSGLFLGVSPWILGVDEGREKGLLLGIGLFEIVVASLSKTKPS
jgi:hypothetical protein